jgi:cell wall-associated NlpC family hydrolase
MTTPDQLKLVIPDARSSLLLEDAIVGRPDVTLTTSGASTITITVDDHDRKLARSEAFTSRSWCSLADLGVNFELVQTRKTGHQVSLTFEDAIAAALRKETKRRRWAAGAATRREIILQLCRGAQVKASVDPDKRKPVQKVVKRGPDSNAWDLTGTLAGDIQWRRFSNGKRLIAGSDEWLLERGGSKPHKIRENTGPWGSLDFDLDTGKRSSTATISVEAEQAAVLPGDGVRIEDDYPATAGLWIVTEYRQALGATTGTVALGRKQHVLKEPKRESSGRAGDPGEQNFLPDREGDPGAAGSGSSATSTAPPARETMVRFALAQAGDAYGWGGNGPSTWDCSGLVEGATRAAGKPLVGASATQLQICQAQGRTIPVATALRTRGALLFRMGSPYNHVAISLGNGSTIEAMGSAYGVLVAGGAASRGWTGAALWI